MLEENNNGEIVDTSTEVDTDNSNDYENTGESEATAEAESENSEPSGSETNDDGAKQRAKSQIDRLKAKIKELEEGGQEGQKSSQESNSPEIDEKYLRLDLKTEGIKTKKEQDIVLDYIREKKFLGQDVEVSDALKSMVVKEELADIKKKSSVTKPSTRTSTQNTDDFDYWVKQAKKGNFPTNDRVMMDRLTKARIFTT